VASRDDPHTDDDARHGDDRQTHDLGWGEIPQTRRTEFHMPTYLLHVGHKNGRIVNVGDRWIATHNVGCHF
jgi:hypothetical protein